MSVIQLYGPFELNSFNGSLLIGMILFTVLILNDRRRKLLIESGDLCNLIIESAIVGIVGARILHILSEWKNYDSLWKMVSIWNGGLSILGAAIAAAGYCIWSLQRKSIPIGRCLDLGAVYFPLLHSIARIGCFSVGCCYGIPTQVPWAVCYTNPEALAPLNISLHPTQLYSTGIFLALFAVLLILSKRTESRPGTLILLYGIGLASERFFVDFFRGDRIMVGALSFQQWIALGLLIGAVLGVGLLRTRVAHESL